MKARWIVSTIVASALTAPAFAQVGIYIGRTPPPLRYEVEGPMPGPGYVWTDGSWAWSGARYEWRRGAWQRPPYEGAHWNHPHYDRYEQGWAVHEGHWDHEDHGDHHDWDHRDHGDHHDGDHR